MIAQPPSPWTPELVQRLAERWMAPGKPSVSIIARELGVSRNAVIGKAHRLGLEKRPSPIRGAVRKRPASDLHRPSGPQPGSLVTDCKFIAGDPHGAFARGENPFCGKPSLPGSAYCGEHHALCYTRATAVHLAEIERTATNAVRQAEAA